MSVCMYVLHVTRQPFHRLTSHLVEVLLRTQRCTPTSTPLEVLRHPNRFLGGWFHPALVFWGGVVIGLYIDCGMLTVGNINEVLTGGQ